MMRVTVYQLEDNALLNPPCFPTSSHHGFTEYFTVSIALQELNQLHVRLHGKRSCCTTRCQIYFELIHCHYYSVLLVIVSAILERLTLCLAKHRQISCCQDPQR